MNDILGRLAPRLERFLFTATEHRGCHVLELDWTHFASLRSLTLEIPADGRLLEVLRQVPAQLATLRLLQAPDGGRRGLLDLVREWPTSMSTLQSLTLPWCTRSERTELECRCAQRGTSVVYRNVDLYGWEAWEDLVLYPW